MKLRRANNYSVVALGVMAVFMWMSSSLVCRIASAQAQNTGTLSGNVTDSSGAVIPKATVTLTSTTTGSVTRAVSNARGEYLFSDVRIGQYRLQVKASGFGDFIVSHVPIDADQNVRIDAKLEIGGAEATVTVEEQGSTIDTRSATVGTLVDQNLIEGLPMDGNNIIALTAYLPGVVDVNAPTTFTSDTGGPTYSASGSRANQNLMLLDGSMWNNVFYNTGLNYPPSFALQEVSVLLSNYKAQYGRNAGSVFNVITRTGTNHYHVTLWEYLQNRALDAADYITQQNPALVQNQYGFTVGGPVRRNRIFFFGSYQALRTTQQVTAQDQYLTPNELGYSSTGAPLPCSTTGAFSGKNCLSYDEDFTAAYNAAVYNNASGQTQTVPAVNKYMKNPMYTNADVATTALNAAYQQDGGTGTSPCVTLLQAALTTYGQYLPYPEMPSDCINPVAQRFVQKYIPASSSLTASGRAMPTTTSFAPQPRNDKDYLIRGDIELGKHVLDMRYFLNTKDDLTSNSVNSGLGVASYEQDRNTAKLNFGSIGDTWIVRPNLLNVFRAGYKRYEFNVMPTDPTTLSALGANLTLPGTPVLPQIVVYNRFTVGSTSSDRSHVLNQNLEFDDNLSWTRGNHNFQAGITWLHLQYNSSQDYPGYYYFAPTYFNLSPADFMSGLLYSETEGNTTNLNASAPNLYLYVQDDWRATSRLTLNYGLRYEIPYMWHEPHGHSATFIPAYQSAVFPTAPANLAYVGDHGILRTLVPTPYKNLSPRFGMAYDLHGNGRTIIRGGFGIFYDAINASVVGVSTPFHYTATYNLPTGGFSSPLLGQNAVPDNYREGQTPQFVSPYSIFFPDKNFTTPYTEGGNLGILQQLGKRGFLEVDYVTKLGRHQAMPVDQNPAIYDCSGSYYQSSSVYCPSSASAGTTSASYEARVRYTGFNYGGQSVVDVKTEATSNYNGLQVIGGIRGTKLLTVQASYTFSKSLDELSNGQTTSASLAKVFPNEDLRYNYGPSDFDSRQVFNLGWVLKMPIVHKGSVVDRAILNGWQYSGTYSIRTGHPFTVRVSGDSALTKESGQRAQPVAGAKPYLSSGRHRTEKVAEYFNTAAFTSPSTGTLSPLSRNSMYGPSFISNNMALGRTFRLPRKSTLQFRADAFNVFNTPNLSNPNANFSTAAGNQYGQVLTTSGPNGAIQTNGRRMQMSLVLKY